MIITKKSSSEHQEVFCNFSTQTWRTRNEKFYRCCVYSTRIFEDIELKFSGIHKEENCTNESVTAIEFNKCEISKIPQGLLKVFPNLKAISIYCSKLKIIRREDLKEYCDLKDFYFADNEIEFLPGDIFDDCENVEVVSFYGNKIKKIDENFLSEAKNLKYLDLEGNLCIDKCFDSLSNEGNSTLHDIKSEIIEKFSIFYWKNLLKDSKIENLKLKNENQKILETENGLKEELRKANRKYLKMKIDAEKMKEKIENLENKNFEIKEKLFKWEKHAKNCEEILIKIQNFSFSFYDRVLQL
ncbi:hypothetical protein PVAND_014548 [Polypedilum vanderplanki]|uniref:Leucine rich repeat protein n=1 Tax=Polypedilum vanderplanki TaxID=319348 RepID=A0A9J6BAB6_POLVA|nr:hypothetical protein PVAND_014548 [Polypedilum vanderplanki]